ncbi:hypothetical protein ACWF0M_01235 [Kribbella sp. NPDC055110]
MDAKQVPQVGLRTGKISSYSFSTNCANITFKVVATRCASKWDGYVH